ncbi:hypothetical protein MMC09_003960 [Bachmanniomyces sp. S44760]|nr:hypothetical protein [Bachmanniomyces sp. S44760]
MSKYETGSNSICSGYNYGYGNGYNNGYSSPWASYGRWIVLAAIIVGAFLIFLIFSCITARRRKRAGIQPWRGTGWAAGNTPAGHAPAQYTGAQTGQPGYNNNMYGNNNAYTNGYAGQEQAPVYSPPAGQPPYHGGENQSYFGGQQNGIELQQPPNAYTNQPVRGGDGVYAPPEGAPPGKGEDGIIR